MKLTDQKKPIPTTPKGVWEASRPNPPKKNSAKDSTTTTDLQGNGYPKHERS